MQDDLDIPNYTRPAPLKRKPFDKRKFILGALAVVCAVVVLSLVWMLVWYFFSFSTYRNAKDGVEIKYPKSWAVKVHPVKDILAAFISPKDNALDTFNENANLSIYDNSKDPLTTEEYVNRIVLQMEAVFKDMRMVSRSSFPVAGRRGYRLVFAARGDVPLIVMVYAVIIEDAGYNLLYIGAVDKFPKDKPLLDIMALLLKLKGPEA